MTALFPAGCTLYGGLTMARIKSWTIIIGCVIQAERNLLSIIQAAGWPIWPLIACSVLAMALIFERFLALKTSRVAPPQLLDEAISVSSVAVPGSDTVAQLEQNSALGAVLAAEYTSRHEGLLGMSDLFQF